MKKNTVLNLMQHFTDNEIVQAINAQHPQSELLFGMLVKRHQAALRARCRSKMQNSDDAEDAAQEAWIRCYRFLANFKAQAEFKTWLFTIADNQCYTLLKKKSRYTEYDDMTDLVDEIAYEASTPEVCTEDVGSVQRVLVSMPEPARDILQLRFHKEMPLNDISDLLGITLSASKMRLYRALEQFEHKYQMQVA